ncbi:MAG: ATP phosphoribosyltransferase regulatory subunit [Pseudomonadota bacterium]
MSSARSSAWLLPEHIADVLPAQARHIEELRRGLLDMARCYGFELVMPPLLEYLDSLLSGTGQTLNLKTFKLVDQLSGRTMGVRADTTPQVARIDAHLLNRQGVARLCYCGPVLHTRPAGPQATREPLQWGAEIYGHAGMEADLEILDLALESLRHSGVSGLQLDLADSRIVRALLAGLPVDAVHLQEVVAALAAKDATSLAALSAGFPAEVRAGLQRLLSLYGGPEVLAAARAELPQRPLILSALSDLQSLAAHVQEAHPEVQVGYDLADLGGYAYYSGAQFSVFAPGGIDSLLRGGRYDEVGAVFGRNRPAVGFSLDVKALGEVVALRRVAAAIRAPWDDDVSLRAEIRRLREQGETVVCVLPGHEHEVQEFDCDRQLVRRANAWQVVPA